MPLMPKDKKLHFVAGIGLATLGTFATVLAGGPPLPVAGFALGYAGAIAKELYDLANPPHVLDYWDAAATKAGAAFAAAVVEIAVQLLRVMA